MNTGKVARIRIEVAANDPISLWLADGAVRHVIHDALAAPAFAEVGFGYQTCSITIAARCYDDIGLAIDFIKVGNVSSADNSKKEFLKRLTQALCEQRTQ